MAKLPKRKSKDSSQPGALMFEARKGPTKTILVGSFVAYLVIVGLFYGGLWGYKRSLRNQIKAKETKIKELQKKGKADEFVEEALSFKNRADSLQTLLDEHRYWTPVFSFLERTALPQVQYTQFDANFSDQTLHLEAITTSFREVARQILIFRDHHSYVEKVEPSSPEITEDGIIFSLRLFLSPDVWRKE